MKDSLAPTTLFLVNRRRLRRIGFALVAVLIGFSIVDQFAAFGAHTRDFSAFDRSECTVTRILDDGRLEVRDASDRTVIVRLLGVDVPPAGAHWADRAQNYQKARALQKPVTLVLDGTQSRDEVGNLLAYVYLSNVESLNLAMVRDGQAFADRRIKHTFQGAFELAEMTVRKKGAGMWKSLRFEQMPSWRQLWLNELDARREDKRPSKFDGGS